MPASPSCRPPSPPTLALTVGTEDKADLLVYRDAGGKLQPVVDTATWARRRAHILANMQVVMGPMPDAGKCVPAELKVRGEAELSVTSLGRLLPGKKVEHAVQRKRITIAVEAGDVLTGYLMVPIGLAAPAPGILALHPTTATGAASLTTGSYGLELAARGYVVIAPNYPNFEDYQVDPYKLGYISATMKGIWNHMRAVDVLQSLPEVDGSRIGAIGFSLGGHNAMFAAVFDDRIKAIVSSSGFNSFYKYIGGNLAGWCHAGYMPLICSKYGSNPSQVPFDFTEVLGALAPRPFWTNSPTEDANFEVSGVQDCMDAASPLYELLGAGGNLQAHYPVAPHSFRDAEREMAYAFFDRALAGK